MDRLDAERRPEKVGESRRMEGIGCQVICGAPTVSPTTGYVNVNVKVAGRTPLRCPRTVFA